VGAALEIVLIFYLVATSSVGLYTLPFLSRVRPRTKMTSLTHIIANCGLVLVLSSALPLLSRILGENVLTLKLSYSGKKKKLKAIPVTGCEGLWGCETSRLPHFL
jgi:hypothetical protein